jgi:predicted ribosomally synthesized peptide with SipW-like signal peptide
MREHLRRLTRLTRLHRLRRMDSRSLRILLSLGMVVGLGATGTFAAWTDSVAVTGTTIQTGTIDLKVNNLDTVTTFTSMNISTMVPGNTTAGVVTVKNGGTAPLKYYVDASASNADGKGLGAALVAKVTGDAATTGSSPTVTCGGSALSGTSTAFGSNLVSSSTPRQLAAGASETLCFQATLPSSAASSLQNATTNITFTFSGTSF